MRKMQPLKTSLIFLLCFAFGLSVYARETYTLQATITDEHKHALAGATVILQPITKSAVSNQKGNVIFNGLIENMYILKTSFIGYQTAIDTINLNANKQIRIMLYTENKNLNELVVSGSRQLSHNYNNTLALKSVDKDFIEKNNGGSFMKSLSRLPGINSMDIGSNQSKPVIRGLGFNRVVVAENGIKHESQEWGPDHGLEIDQFNVERVEIVKGPASLMYGSNAIGGVIDLKQISTPQKNSSGGEAMLALQSNNEHYSALVKFYKRIDKFYFKSHASLANYADYKVPTDSINYKTYNIVLNNRRLRNTAGNERNGSLTLGYVTDNFSSHVAFSNNFSKSGFFANAHGLEIRNSLINFDAKTYDIDLPYQQVNHFKILNNNTLLLKDYKLNIDIAYQHNYRKEFSERIEHGNMPLPPDTLERLYNKKSYAALLKIEFPKHNIHQLTAGLQSDFQKNNSGGWGFMLPDFQAQNAGAFVYDNLILKNGWLINAGVRYDYGAIQTQAYYDWYVTKLPNGDKIYQQRANELNREFQNFNWGIGISKKNEFSHLKINIGKSFRMPTAKELASNGINYHMYRYEKGDSTLKAEKSYQLDASYEYNNKKWQAEINPFLNYFPNYIFLNPTALHYEAQQVFAHNQSSVFRAGGELAIIYQLTTKTKIAWDAEYIYSVQLSGSKKGFTLPFSPPLSTQIEITCKLDDKKHFKKTEIGSLLKLSAAQNNIVPPEKKTPGYAVLNLLASTELLLFKQPLMCSFQINNVLNTKYLEHSSFYRLIEVPAQGRNVLISFRFGLNKKQVT